MRKEKTELFSNNIEEIPNEEIYFNGRAIYQPVDPLGILLEEIRIKNYYPKKTKTCGNAQHAKMK